MNDEYFVGTIDFEEWIARALRIYPKAVFDEATYLLNTFVVLSTRGKSFEGVFFTDGPKKINLPEGKVEGNCWLRLK